MVLQDSLVKVFVKVFDKFPSLWEGLGEGLRRVFYFFVFVGSVDQRLTRKNDPRITPHDNLLSFAVYKLVSRCTLT